MAMMGHMSVRLPRYFKNVLCHCNSTVAYAKRTVLSPRPQLPSTVCVPHFMGTWTDKIKSRWQSGSQTDKPSSKKEVQEKAGEKAESGDRGSENTSAELRQLLSEKETLVQANEEKIKDLQDKYLRALAESENTRNRLTRQVEDAKKFGIQDFSKDIVEVADILDKAIDSVKPDDLEDNSPLTSLFEGLKLTEAELYKVMKKNGLQRIDEEGVTFDPNIHEALFEVPGDKQGTVAVVSRVGYILHGRTVRPARVGVVKAPDS